MHRFFLWHTHRNNIVLPKIDKFSNLSTNSTLSTEIAIACIDGGRQPTNPPTKPPRKKALLSEKKKTFLEPQTTICKWMFGETTIFYIKIWNHPITIYKWLFGVPGYDY